MRADRKLRDLQDAFNGVDGIEYQEGVNLDDILQAAKLNPAEIDEITPELVTKAIETARLEAFSSCLSPHRLKRKHPGCSPRGCQFAKPEGFRRAGQRRRFRTTSGTDRPSQSV